MKKFFIPLFSLVLLFTVSCSKDDVLPNGKTEQPIVDEPTEQPVADLVPVSFSVEMSGGKVAYYNTNLKKAFHGNDSIFVADNFCNFSKAVADPTSGTSVGDNLYSKIKFSGATLSESATQYTSVYPYSSSISINTTTISGMVLPTEQLAPADNFDPKAMLLFAQSNNINLFFQNLCGYISLLSVNNSSNCASITVESEEEALAGTCSVNIASASLTNFNSKTVTLKPSTGTTFANGKEYFMTIRPGYYTQLIIRAKDISGNVIATRVVRGKTYAKGTVYTAEIEGNDLRVVGSSTPLDGQFSVSATKKVRFSSGNLQYQSSSDNFRFAQDQYLSIGADNSKVGSDASAWIDLFGWGTGNAATRHTLADNDYSTYSNWGNMMNESCFGELQSTGYRVLTHAEWDYLLARPGKTSMATITAFGSTYVGLLLLPDSFTKPSSCSFTAGFSSKYATNSYTFDQWEAMQKAGAVFLPAAGLRNGTSLDGIDVVGGYWASDQGLTYSSKPVSYYLNFGCGDAFTIFNDYRHIGRSVRLVVDAN